MQKMDSQKVGSSATSMAIWCMGLTKFAVHQVSVDNLLNHITGSDNRVRENHRIQRKALCPWNHMSTECSSRVLCPLLAVGRRQRHHQASSLGYGAGTQ